MSNETSGFLAGGKTGVLVLHDLGESAEDLRQLARHLHQHGFTVALPQLAHEGDRNSVTASSLIRDAELSLAKLRERCSDVVIVGVAYGAMLALEIARQNKVNVQAVVMVEPRAWLPGLRLPFASKVSSLVRQAWIAEALNKVRVVSERGRVPASRRASDWNHSEILGLAPSRPERSTVAADVMVSAGQVLDCLHATLHEIQQPVLVIRRQDAPGAVIDSSILLQRKLGGRVETGVLDQSSYAEASVERHQEHVAERAVRFLAAVMDELATRRDNEQRRQRTGAGRSNAA